jgi:hypothetical protein
LTYVYIFMQQSSHTLVDAAKTSVVHLVGAVEDNDIFAQAAAHVFGGLSLACTGRARRGST